MYKSINEDIYIESYGPFEEDYAVVQQDTQKIIGWVREGADQARPSAKIPDQFFDDIETAARFVALMSHLIPAMRGKAAAETVEARRKEDQ